MCADLNRFIESLDQVILVATGPETKLSRYMADGFLEISESRATPEFVRSFADFSHCDLIGRCKVIIYLVDQDVEENKPIFNEYAKFKDFALLKRVPFIVMTDIYETLEQFQSDSGWIVDYTKPSGLIARNVLKNLGNIEIDFPYWMTPSSLASQELRRQKTQANIDRSAPSYIENTLDDLENRRKFTYTISMTWIGIGFTSLVLGLVFGYRLLDSFLQLLVEHDFDPVLLTFLGAKSAVLLGLLTAISKYALSLGKMNDAKAEKLADRRHAISFGKFYLNIYGAEASPEDVVSVFQHWNIGQAASDEAE